MRRWTKAIALVGMLVALAWPGQAPAPAFAQNSAANPDFLEQNWTQKERRFWNTTSQGSRLLPFTWVKALEVAGGTDRFLTSRNLARLGYVPGPDGDLPLGFVEDRVPAAQGGSAIGLTCAACHTAQLRLGNKEVRLDGGPALADFEGLMRELLESLQATRADTDKLRRFLTAVAGASSTAQTQAKAKLDERIAWYAKLWAANKSPTPYGRGRLDAQGHILNKVAAVVGPTQDPFWPADAPTSYPFIWNAPQHDKVQWNGIAPNGPRSNLGAEIAYGALARNVGEVLGVFAEINAASGVIYPSSARIQNLIKLERLLGKLWSPRWPAEHLGAIEGDRALGRKLFADSLLTDAARPAQPPAKCISCHLDRKPDDIVTKIEAKMQPIQETGTDIWTACNTFVHASRAGVLEGHKELVIKGDVIQALGPTTSMMRNLVTGMVTKQALEIGRQMAEDLGFGRRPPDEDRTFMMASPPAGIDDPYRRRKTQRAIDCRARNDMLAYKARPLNGIWATAPYLHNGSVLTLYDLLLPSKAHAGMTIGVTTKGGAPRLRREVFTVGSREFDAKEVGLVSAPGPGLAEVRARDAAGLELFGNSNAGHEWGAAELTDEERWALVAYLKSL